MDKPMNNNDQRMIMLGCLCLMFAIAAYGLSLSTIQGPILAELQGSQYFSHITVFSSIALCVMTPVGGRLADMIPVRKLLLLAGGLTIVSGLAMTFIPNLWIFMVFRVLLSLSQGLYASLPFIIVRQIYPAKQTPKAVGYLIMCSAVGGLLGSLLAGWLTDMGQMKLAIAFPLIPLGIGMFLISTRLKTKPDLPFDIDVLGIILLTITLGGILMGLNNGPVEGWFSRGVVFAFAAGIFGLLAFVFWENQAKVPIIPMRLLLNRQYSLILMIGFCLMFYMNAANVYMPLAVQDILNAGTAASGTLQMPKTIVTMIFPAIVSAWIVKKGTNLWKSMAMAGALIAICFGFLVFTGPHMPLWFIMAMLALTGLSDSFRSVALLPAAQNVLSPKEMGVGTSLISFISTLAGSISSAFFGLAYNSLTKATPGMRGQIDGIDTICLITCIVGIMAFLLVVLFYRPMLEKQLAAKEEEASQPAKKAA